MTTDELKRQVHALRTAVRDDCGAGASRGAFAKAQAAEETLLASIARLQAEVLRLEDKKRTICELAEANNQRKGEHIARLQAQVDALAGALRDAVAMIDSLNSAYGADGPDSVAKACRAALTAAGR